MLTGRELFGRETISDTLAAVLKEEPDLTRAPAQVRRLLHACLQKDPKQRLQATGDSRLLLDDAPEATPEAKSRASCQIPRVSPDGSKLVWMVSQGPSADLWIYDWPRGRTTR